MKKNWKFFLKKYSQTDTLFFFLTKVIFIFSLLILLWVGIRYIIPGKRGVEEEMTPEEIRAEEQDCENHRLLDGLCVENKEDMTSELIGVMIENHFEARPVSGLSKARVVYEAPAEGNITRFFAIFFNNEEVESVGPVRSARTYYLDWASEYGDIMYMHVGGSPDALEKIDEYQIFDMNEMYRGWYFWRSTDRYAPHNTYTSSKLWNQAWKAYGEENTNQEFLGWKFGKLEEGSCGDTCVSDVEISYAPPTYSSVWKYTSSTEQFVRYEGGRIHRDREGGEIVADTLIVQKIVMRAIDNVGRLDLDTIGSGQALIFRNGQVIEGEWKKTERKGRTRFYDFEGNEISFKSGKIWISIVGENHRVEY
ncbi:MAG: DUF3048 domain-containing protein [Candidatus Magasanikbacteria bacterium]